MPVSSPLRESIAALLESARITSEWASVGTELAVLLRCLQAPLCECLAAASILDAAAAAEKLVGVYEACVWLEDLRVMPHLLVPREARPDARLPLTYMNALRDHLEAAATHQGQGMGISGALACTLLPQWVCAIPEGPHLSLQIRVVCKNLTAVFRNSGSPVCQLSALNSLVAVVRQWYITCAGDSIERPPDFISDSIQAFLRCIQQSRFSCPSNSPLLFM